MNSNPDVRCTAADGRCISLIIDDVAAALKQYPDHHFHGCLSDPPYGIGIAGQPWDATLPPLECWQQILRVLRPGAHALVFGDPRTYHRMAVDLEESGFEIRDCMMWLFPGGRPRSRTIAELMSSHKASEKEAQAAIQYIKDRRQELGMSAPDVERAAFGKANRHVYLWERGDSLPNPKEWMVVVRALGLESTPFDHLMVRGYKTVEEREGNFWNPTGGKRWNGTWKIRKFQDRSRAWADHGTGLRPGWVPIVVAMKPLGTERFPANAEAWGVAGLNLAASQELDDTRHPTNVLVGEDTIGPNSRYFFSPKATQEERDVGCSAITTAVHRLRLRLPTTTPGSIKGNPHSAVKPLSLDRYLAKLLLPPQGTESHLVVPFAGSGSEAIAASQIGFDQVTAIEMDPVFAYIAALRVVGAAQAPCTEISPTATVPDADGKQVPLTRLLWG